MAEVSKYVVKAFNKRFYCKITNFPNNGKINTTFSFGGSSYYCITVALNSETPETAYMDRMEYNWACVKDGTLEHKQGTEQLGLAALWTLYSLFQRVKTITFIDDSHIYCEKDSKTYKLNLAHDYILKYNKTWYEDKFHAQLPEPLYTSYKQTQKLLDAPLAPFEFQYELIPEMKQYETIYNTSSTPREFINALRKEYGTQYCVEVSKWLTRYIESLSVKIFKESWVIYTKDLVKPREYSLEKTTKSMRGGGKTRKNADRRPRNFSIVHGGGDECNQIMGYYNE